uniref:Kinesin family member 27 n=1 Tax=Leptobrachium leishanense TaxID=445787 RepID=A0A8C5LZU9_9ANUR
MEETPVKVAVRIRPLLSREILHNHQVCVRLVPHTKQIIVGKDRAFTFDFVFGKTSAQDDVYGSCIQPLLASLIEGYNVTVFAYGQTGSGKTYTIGGGHVASVADEDNGIIPRAVQELFQNISEHHNADFTIKVSYIEVYKEELRDLLELETNVKDIHIREDDKGNTVIVGAKECEVESADEVMSLLEAGSAVRHTSITQMNEHSSRSHSIFTISICQQRAKNSENASTVQIISSKFHFVDLAGSERVTKTGNTGERFKESVQINSGLLALGNVISALADPKRKSTHVPYRDAKITRILKDSLGGNAKTVMITCISPSSSDFDESLNSLKYANRARNIKNKPIVNYNPDFERIDEMELEIKILREALHNQQSNRMSRIGQVSQEWSQDKDKIRTLEEHVAQFQLECSNYRHCTEEAMELLYELKDVSILTPTQKNRLQSWLNMTEGIKNELAALSGKDTTTGGTIEEPHHITIIQLKRELRKCQEALATDEDMFAKKERELKTLTEQVQSLLQENEEKLKGLEELEHTKNLQTEKLVEQQLLINELKSDLEKISYNQPNEGDEEEKHFNVSRRPYSVPLQHHSPMMFSGIMESSTQPVTRKVHTSPPSYSLERMMAGFRTRSQMILDLVEAQDVVLHEKFSDQSDEEDKVEEKKKKTLPRRSINRTLTRSQAQQSAEKNSSGTPAHKLVSQSEDLLNKNVSDKAIVSLHESQVLNIQKLKNSELRLGDAKQKMRELMINIKMKEELIKELMKTGNDAQSINEQYSLKISELEQEAQQAKSDLAEAQRQQQELENKELRDTTQKAKLQRDFRKQMEAAKLKVQVLQKKQQDTQKLASISIQNEKRVTDLEQNISHMRQQHTQLQKKLKDESEKKRKLELAIQKDQHQIKELQIKTEQQQKILKIKNEEIAAIRRRKSSTSIPDQLQIQLEEQKKWLDEEVEKVLKERQALHELEEDLKKREESITKKELLLQEKSHLEIKQLRSSQALNSNMLKLSNRLSVVESELNEKSKKLRSGNTEEQRKSSEEIQVLQKERNYLLQRRDSLDEKLKNGTVLSPEEERTLFQLEEGIDALEAAIDYKNECIQIRQQSVKNSTQILTQSEASILQRFSSLSPVETRSIFVRYFNKVVSLRESERKLQVQSQELAMKVTELENIVRELESALDHLTLQSDRQLIQQQKEHEQKMQILLQHVKDKDGGTVAGNVKEYEGKIEELEKELFFYKKTSRELKKKLREVVGETGAVVSKGNSAADSRHKQNDIEPIVSKLQMISQSENIKPNKKVRDTSYVVPNSTLRQTTYRLRNAEVDEQSSDSRWLLRRQISSGDDGDDIEEACGTSHQTQDMPQISKVGPTSTQLRVTSVKLSRREVRQISVSELSTRRSSIGSITADSIEIGRKSTDFKA